MQKNVLRVTGVNPPGPLAYCQEAVTLSSGHSRLCVPRVRRRLCRHSAREGWSLAPEHVAPQVECEVMCAGHPCNYALTSADACTDGPSPFTCAQIPGQVGVLWVRAVCSLCRGLGGRGGPSQVLCMCLRGCVSTGTPPGTTFTVTVGIYTDPGPWHSRPPDTPGLQTLPAPNSGFGRPSAPGP